MGSRGLSLLIHLFCLVIFFLYLIISSFCKMACCYGCVRFTLFLFNLFVTVIGALIIGFGVYAYIELKEIDLSINATDIASQIPGYNDDLNITDTVNVVEINEENFANATNPIDINVSDILGFNLEYIGVVIIVLGGIIFWISFCGCCGSICSSKCLLGLYTFMMLLLVGAQIYLCIAIYNLLLNDFMELIKSAFEDEALLTLTEAMTSCCGTTGSDYYNNTSSLPPTCCGKPVPETCSIQQDSIYPGCNGVIRNGLQYYVITFRIIFLIAIGCELLTSSMAIYLMCTKGKRNKREKPVVINYLAR